MVLLLIVIVLFGTQVLQSMDVPFSESSEQDSMLEILRQYTALLEQPPAKQETNDEQVLAFFNLQPVNTLQVPAQHASATNNQPSSNGNENGTSDSRALEDYIQPKKMGEIHPLIKDGYLIDCDNNEYHRYKCTQCNNMFTDFNHAQRHSVHHLGLKFKCGTCNFYHSELYGLTKHTRKKHLTCCQKTFDSQELLNQHITNQLKYHNLHVKPIIMKNRKKYSMELKKALEHRN